METKSEFVELSSIFKAVARRWWLVLLFGLAAGAAGYFVSINQKPVYQATTSLLVGSSIQSATVDRNDLQASELLASTYADLTRRQPVLQRAIDELGLDMSWGKLRSRVQADVPGATQLLEIRVEGDSPEQAVSIADAIARQLVLLSPSGEPNLVKQFDDEATRQQMAELQAKIASGQETMEALEQRFLSSADNEVMIELENRINTLQGMLNRWKGSYDELQQSLNRVESANNLAVLEPAQARSRPVRPRVQVNTIIAVIVGIALALGMIFLMEFLDDSLKNAGDLRRTLGLSTLGSIDKIKIQKPRDALIVNHDPFSAAYEDYRLLRTKIQFMAVDHPGRTVMITSPSRGDGKSLTVANLGIVMAQAGLRTVIVDANLRQPIQHELFQVPNQGGLTHLLRGQPKNIDQYLTPTLVPNLKVLPSGVVPSNPSELLGSPQMSSLLADLRSMVDVVICDSTEAVTVADASVLSSKVDGVLLVVDCGRTERAVAIHAVENLRDANASIMGAVLNRVGSRGRIAPSSLKKGATTTVQTQESAESLVYQESIGA